MNTSLVCTALLGAATLLAVQPGHAQTVTTGTIHDAGDTIYYEMEGSGPPMMLVHGFPLSSRLFDAQRAAFAKSYTVITPDLPGFGHSTTGTTSQTIGRYASEMLALLQHLHVGPAIIGGHSMGGQVVLDMYHMQPDRFRGMILFDTNPQPASIVEMAEWPAYGRMAEKMGSASIAPSVVAVMVTGDSIKQDPTLATDVTSIVSMAMPTGVAGGGNALATRPNLANALGKIAVPTLVLVGQDDPVYPVPVSQATAAAIPGSTLAIIPGAAHASMLQSPDAVDTAITSWLSTVP